jgi:transcriptional regulator with XRE-family HTH domain
MKPGEIDWKFKKSVADRGITQRELGKLAGVNHTMLSLYAHGRWNLNKLERKKIARILKRPESQIFSD